MSLSTSLSEVLGGLLYGLAALISAVIADGLDQRPGLGLGSVMVVAVVAGVGSYLAWITLLRWVPLLPY